MKNSHIDADLNMIDARRVSLLIVAVAVIGVESAVSELDRHRD